MCSDPVMRAPLSGWLFGELLADGHQAGHFGLRDADFLAAPGGQRDVGDGAILGGGGFENGVHVGSKTRVGPLLR